MTYYERNKDKILERQKKYYLANKDKISEYNRQYYLKHRKLKNRPNYQAKKPKSKPKKAKKPKRKPKKAKKPKSKPNIQDYSNRFIIEFY